MAPLKVLLLRNRDRIRSGIHGWEVMAPLKGAPGQRRGRLLRGIHGWEVMAPLKDGQPLFYISRVSGYPWLGGHGSIEGRRLIGGIQAVR